MTTRAEHIEAALREMKELFRAALLCTSEEIARDGMVFIRKAEAALAMPPDDVSGELLAALRALLGHWIAFNTGGFGNQEDAYNCLAKGAQDTWRRAQNAVAAAERGGR